MAEALRQTALGQEDDDLAAVEQAFATRVSADVRAQIRHNGDPVARQYLPDARELMISPAERADPIGDHAHSPVKGIVHRHQDRVLFKLASVCAVNCRFCFRRTMLGTPEETLNAAETDAALAYIAAHPEIREVILTGGDPLILAPRRLATVMTALDHMDHPDLLRIHSRVPVAAPSQLTDAHIAALTADKPRYMVLHINHAQEISPAMKQAVRQLQKAGVVLLSQSVLLKGVNDNLTALRELFYALLALNIKPYYLHHPDLVPGTGHFRVTIAQGQALVRQLRRSVTGLAMPTYVLDIPGGGGKIPLEQAYIEKTTHGYTLYGHDGAAHHYPVD